ncbi:MAG: hypothetical protein ACRC6I_01895 [Paracoccaceae bacterium]
MTTEDFRRRFKIVPTSLFGLWRDLSHEENQRGDCQDFAWTVLIIETGSKAAAIKALLTGRAMIWRCWSPVNGAIPRHAVLYLRGKGWTDSANREWRDGPRPHTRAWPAGAPVLAAMGFAAYTWVRLRGWV